MAAKVYFVDSGGRPKKEIARDNLIVLPEHFACIPYQVNCCMMMCWHGGPSPIMSSPSSLEHSHQGP